MPGRFLLALGLCVPLAGGGCATVKNVESFDPKPYGGVAMSADDFFAGAFFPLKPVAVAVGRPFWLLDKPFALVGDTVTLPYLLYKQRDERPGKGGPGAEPDPSPPPTAAASAGR